MSRVVGVLTLVLCWLFPARAEFVCAGSVSLSASTPAAKPARLAQSRTTGTRRALVLFARFKGDPANPVPAWSADIFNPELPGSFSHFYDTMSFGKFQVRGEVGPRVYESAQPASAYLSSDSSEQGQFGVFTLEILRQADRDLDFSRFDNDGPDGVPNSGDDDGAVDAVFLVLDRIPTDFLQGEATGISNLGFSEAFLSSDPGAKGKVLQVFPDQGTLQQGRFSAEAVGAMCHEYGHVLGLPDLYNTDFLAQGGDTQRDGAGVGAWCLMGWGASGWNGDDGPNSFCAWSREKLGWAMVRDVVTEHQELRLEEVGRQGEMGRVFLTGREYFLLEYRKRTSTYYDRNLPGEGLLIWHVGERRLENALASQVVVDLECADGRWQDAGYPVGQVPDPQAGEDNLDFWAHDAQYAQAHRGNLGDATDPFDGVRFTAFTPQTNPASYSLAGTLSARIEGIHREDNVMVARVQIAPLVVETKNLRLLDEDGDGIALAGERLQVRFTLANTGGLLAQQVKALLRSDDPWVEILQGESHFQDLKPGGSSFGSPAEGFPALRLRDGFVGVHQVALTLEIYAGETLVGQYDLEVNGVSPRQQVQRVAVIDSLGNGDGVVQGGEFIRLQVELEQVEDPAPLRYFTLVMRALDSQIRSLGSTQVVLADTATKTGSSGEFLVPVGVAPGSQLRFKLEVRSLFNTWRDTIVVEVAAGPDQTPPRVLGLQTRPVAGGVRLVLPADRVLEGGQVRRAEAVIYSRSDTSEVARVPLGWQDHHYEGVWTTAQDDFYLAAAMVEDEAGNRGWSRLQGFAVRPDEGMDAPAMAGAWEEIALPEKGRRPNVYSLLRAPGNPEVLYAMGSQGIWRSVDGGGSWERLGVIKSDLWGSLAVDAVDPFLLYTLNWNGYIARSRDGGMSWEALEEAVYLLAADPVRSGRLYGAAQGNGGRLLISEDRGETWSPTPVDTADFVEVNPAYPQSLYSGYSGRLSYLQRLSGTLWRSADGGRTWAQSRLAHPFYYVVADPRSPLGLYATGQDTLWHSADGGDTWQPLWTRRKSWPRLTIHPADPQQLLVVRNAMNGGSVSNRRSRDAGQTWEEVVVPYSVSSLVLDPRDPDQYYAVVSSWDAPVSLLRSADAGGHWEEVALPEIGPPISTVIFDYRGQIYAGASRHPPGGDVLPGFFFSPGDGQEWVSHDAPPVDLLYVDAQQPQIVIAATVVGFLPITDGGRGETMYGYLRSTDGGRSWRRVWRGGFYPGFVADPRQAGVYYLPHSGGVWRSADYGETLEDRSAGLPSMVAGLALDTHAGAAVLYASIASGRLWRSPDEGQHWEYAGTLTLGEGENIVGLATNPLAADQLYALTDHGGVYVSTDQGQGWTRLLPGEGAWAKNWSFERVRLRFDPGDPERFFVVTGPRLLETQDGGQHWRSLGDGLASVPWFNDVAVDPLAPHLLYAATPWGLYRLDTSSVITAVEEAGPVPQHFALHQNFPNPFNPTTTIRFSLSQGGEAELSIYDLLGQEVAILVRGVQEAGIHTLAWNGRDDAGRELASGVYFCRLQAGARVETRKLLLLR